MSAKKIKGKWWQIEKQTNNNYVKAQYDKIKDWVMDPKGYFLINIDREKKNIRVGYCKLINLKKKNEIHKLVSEIRGTTSIEIVNTLIKLKYISSLQHAADMGIELHKAEIALKKNIKYIQDKELDI